MAIEPTFDHGASKDPLAAMKSIGRTPTVDPAARPTGAAAFVAREKVKNDRSRPSGKGRAGPLLAAVGVLAFATALGAWALVDAAPAPSGSEASAPAPHKAEAAPSGPALAEAAPSPVEAVGPVETVDTTEAPPAPATDKAVASTALEKERVAKAAEIAESQKQIESLRKQRAELQQQIADLSATLSPSAGEDKVPPPVPPEKSAGPVPTPKPRPAVAQAASSVRVDNGPLAAADARRNDGDRTVIASRRDDFGSSAMGDAPANGYVRVFIHVQAGDPYAMERAEEVADALVRRGVDVAGIRAVPHAVRTDIVRFFHDSDEASVGLLGRALATASSGRSRPPITQDFRNRSIAPRPGTLEIWLS